MSVLFFGMATALSSAEGKVYAHQLFQKVFNFLGGCVVVGVDNESNQVS